MDHPVEPIKRDGSTDGDRRTLAFGAAAVILSFVVYVLASLRFDAGRPDFFYLADAFLNGRIWLDHAFGPWDNVVVGARVYVPFAPFPAIAELPLVALFGPAQLDRWEQVVDSAFAAIDVGLCWWLMGRVGVRTVVDRIWIVFLFGFSTQILWVTTRGGVWHTGHLVAMMLMLAALLEGFGRRRGWLLGLLVGAGFLTRAPLVLAAPFFAWLLWDEGSAAGWPGPRGWPIRRWALYAAGIAPAVLFALWYNAARFGSPLESGYALASLPPFLQVQRDQGLFSLSHLPMNLDYLLVHLPAFVGTQPDGSFGLLIPPRPDGLGLSIFLTSPGLLLALRADLRSRMTVALSLTALAVLIPSLLYYGGGWLQYGYRYALDSIPFVMAIVGLAVARRGLPGWGKVLIVFGMIVNLLGVYWAYNL
jgi:hypothetical protein